MLDFDGNLVTLRNGRAVTFGVGISLSARQLGLSPTKDASCLKMGYSRSDFQRLIGVFRVHFLLFVFTMLTTCCRYPVDIFDGDIMPLLYCLNPGIADTHSSL